MYGEKVGIKFSLALLRLVFGSFFAPSPGTNGWNNQHEGTAGGFLAGVTNFAAGCVALYRVSELDG